MKTSTMCTVQNRHHAERTVDLLISAGFSNRDISALLPNTVSAGDATGVHLPLASRAASVNGGCVLGGTIGLLKGLSAIEIPGFGQVAVAGPLFATLSSAASKTVGLTDAFIHMGIPTFEARRFEAKAQGGNLLVFVYTDSLDAQKRVIDIFNAAYAVDICSAVTVAIARILQICSPLQPEIARNYSSTGRTPLLPRRDPLATAMLRQ
jgi:hypothetical protein